MSRSYLKTVSLWLTAVACLLSSPAGAVTIDMVTVGNRGNANDTTGYGGVVYDYHIGKYDVTIGQYTEFLNAVAKTDTYSLYKDLMGTDRSIRGISRTGESGNYSYSVIGPDGVVNGQSGANRPITLVSWFDSARFANWMANGQPTGDQDDSTTENGAYNLANSSSGTAPARNVTNPNTGLTPTYVIPTENEWYKAAYYSPLLNSGSGGYYTYATQSNATPGNVIGSGANQANYAPGDVYSVTQLFGFDENQNYLTDVGAFTNSASFYGTFDQSGNVNQWNDLDGNATDFRGVRGGNWAYIAASLSSSSGGATDPSIWDDVTGFRLASPVSNPSAVPEIDPNSLGSVLALVLGSLGLLERRRLKAA